MRIVPRIRPTSPDLAAVFARQRETGVPPANDTSLGVGFAPLDDLERIVLEVERRLNSPEMKRAQPEIGEDIKVMGARHGGRIVLTIACALVGRHVANLADYQAKKARVCELALDAARSLTRMPIEAQVNTADGDTPDSVYLTVTGLSAESGDDGQVGRGNRVNGLITPYRPMTLEAAAGKNPVTHVGKLYNVMANRIARALISEVPGRRRGVLLPSQQDRQPDHRAAAVRHQGAARRWSRAPSPESKYRRGRARRARPHRLGVARGDR